MKNRFMLLKMLAVIVALAVGGCTSGLEQRMKRLENSMNDLRAFQAEQTTQISSIQQSVRQLTGKTEEIEYSTQQRKNTDLEALRADLSSLKRRVPPPANVPVQALEDDEALAARFPNPRFADALGALRTANYTDALQYLQEVSSENPSDIGANLLFWIGVAYDGLGESKNALATYNDLVVKFPRHRRAPLALLRQASIFDKIGDGRALDITLKKLQMDYADSPEAMQVKSKLGEDKRSAPPAKKKK